jgi:acyl-coenzyme A thioesterase PaaI-like protein
MSHPAPPPGNGYPGVDGPPTSTGDDPINRLARAARRISAVAVGHPLEDDEISDAADRLAEVADELEKHAAPGKRPREQPERSGHPQDFFSASPMVGQANPIAPPVEVWAVEGESGQREIRGRVTFGYPDEGPPTCVHGGVIAELFDELLGSANILANRAGMTGTLTVRYRKPTPLLTPLDLVARMTGTERRKIFTWGGIYHDGELTAEAEGIFILVQPGRMLDIVTTNAREAEGPVIDSEFARLIAENASPPS